MTLRTRASVSSRGNMHICQLPSSVSMPVHRVGAGVNQKDWAGPTIGLASKVVFPRLCEMQTFYKPFSLKELGLDFKAAEQNRVVQALNYWTKSMDNDTKGFNVHEIFSGYCSILSALRALLPDKASKPSGSHCICWHGSTVCPQPHWWHRIPTRNIQDASFMFLNKGKDYKVLTVSDLTPPAPLSPQFSSSKLLITSTLN